MTRESTAEERIAAARLFGMFNALIQEGFKEEQALVILGFYISNQGR